MLHLVVHAGLVERAGAGHPEQVRDLCRDDGAHAEPLAERCGMRAVGQRLRRDVAAPERRAVPPLLVGRVRKLLPANGEAGRKKASQRPMRAEQWVAVPDAASVPSPAVDLRFAALDHCRQQKAGRWTCSSDAQHGSSRMTQQCASQWWSETDLQHHSGMTQIPNFSPKHRTSRGFTRSGMYCSRVSSERQMPVQDQTAGAAVE